VKIFYSNNSLFIGERGGGQFQELASIRPLRDFQRTRVHSDVPRVTFFLLNFKVFCAIGSSESTRFPEGLVLGNLGKICHPQNAGFDEIHEISFQGR
jgi:hypothetical protein